MVETRGEHHQSSHATGPVEAQTGRRDPLGPGRMPLAGRALVRPGAHAYATKRPVSDLADDVLSGVVKFANTGEDGQAR
jgi:hypothetical protein